MRHLGINILYNQIMYSIHIPNILNHILAHYYKLQVFVWNYWLKHNNNNNNTYIFNLLLKTVKFIYVEIKLENGFAIVMVI